MYSYRFRPGYGSNKFLIEFIKGVEENTFLSNLIEALSQIEPVIDSSKNLWMNDEVLFNINSSKGKFILSKDVWNCAFIMAEENQKCLKIIDEILNKNKLFIKEDVNFSEYGSTS